MKKFSDFMHINITDLGRGFIMTLITTAVAFLWKEGTENNIPTLVQLKSALLIGFGAGISYLLKNLAAGQPKEIHIDPAKTTIIDSKTKEIITQSPIKN